MKTCLIYIKVGDPVIHEDVNGYGKTSYEKCTLLKMELVPNGMDDRSLVCVLTVKTPRNTSVSATSDRFLPDPEFEYELIHK